MLWLKNFFHVVFVRFKFRGEGRQSYLRELVPAVLLIASVSLNIRLAVELRSVRSTLAATPFSSGNIAPDLLVHGPRADVETLHFTSQPMPVLLYWFAPQCVWCESNIENLKALSAQAGKSYRLFAISTAPRAVLAEYAASHHLHFPLYRVNPDVARAFHVVEADRHAEDPHGIDRVHVQ